MEHGMKLLPAGHSRTPGRVRIEPADLPQGDRDRLPGVRSLSSGVRQCLFTGRKGERDGKHRFHSPGHEAAD